MHKPMFPTDASGASLCCVDAAGVEPARPVRAADLQSAGPANAQDIQERSARGRSRTDDLLLFRQTLLPKLSYPGVRIEIYHSHG